MISRLRAVAMIPGRILTATALAMLRAYRRVAAILVPSISGSHKRMADGAASLPNSSGPVQPQGRPTNAEIYSMFRSQAFSVTRADIGITDPKWKSAAWGALLEMRMEPGITILLVTFADGSTSMYLDNGGAVIGGHSHETVRQSAARFLGVANQLLEKMAPTATYTSPELGRVSFFVRMDSGVKTAEASLSDVEAGHHTLSPLYFSAHEVIAELRKLAQSQGQGAGAGGN